MIPHDTIRSYAKESFLRGRESPFPEKIALPYISSKL
jgi:hypothetical protein